MAKITRRQSSGAYKRRKAIRSANRKHRQTKRNKFWEGDVYAKQSVMGNDTASRSRTSIHKKSVKKVMTAMQSGTGTQSTRKKKR